MRKTIIFNIGFWLFLWLVFAFSIMRFESATESFRIASLVVFPLIIPVYIHDFIFDYFIIKKQYIPYLLSTTFLVVFFGYIIAEFQHYLEPVGSSETYGALLFMMILYTGARYFRIGTQQRMRLKEEEEKRIKAEMELKELEAKQSQAELNLLKSQVNPHFLFNSLNSIYSLILNDSDISADAVMKLSDLMRYLLDSSKKRKVLVKHEFEFLQNYIDLEKIRLGKKAQVKSSFKGDLSGKIISPLLLIAFIENCFKHGISVNSKENEIDISVELKENTVLLRTSNNVAPQRINPLTIKSGTGIENVKKRLELLYPGKHKLEINNDEKEFIVNLVIEI
ncbi:MAG: histidine kinase [Bacteroidales bacterium]|nr:histidine kinase [Bacteroidales bacterium]